MCVYTCLYIYIGMCIGVFIDMFIEYAYRPELDIAVEKG